MKGDSWETGSWKCKSYSSFNRINRNIVRKLVTKISNIESWQLASNDSNELAWNVDVLNIFIEGNRFKINQEYINESLRYWYTNIYSCCEIYK